MTAPIEVTTRYATSFDTLQECFAFIMDKVETVGPHPQIEIRPYTQISVAEVLEGQDSEYVQRFEVVVSGMVHAD